MNSNPNQVFDIRANPDTFSITELEEAILANPIDIIPRIILSKKMGINESHELLLYINDRTFVHQLMQEDQNSMTIEQIKGSMNHIKAPKSLEIVDEILPLKDENENLQVELTNATETIKADEEIDQNTVILIKEYPENETIDTPQIQIEELEKSNRKTRKKSRKKNKYKLNEYSGISPYSQWLLSFKSDDIEKKIKKEQKIAKKKAFDEAANRSIKKSANILSEPLAELLVTQGHLDEAKKMYELLMIKYPEKSIYFAEKINQIIKI
ncbi:MAG: hypothetical protein IPL55_05605 [Saprospiraceae bacterium]|nr:hypothetical protein [Saprospiraceae bacterium]